MPLGKTFSIFDVIIATASVLEKDGKSYPQVIRMLQCEKVSVSEGIDLDKTNTSKECMLCHYCFFKVVGFKFESYVCNKCHDVLMTAYELKNIAILNVKGVVFRCILWGISRDEAVTRFSNSVLEDKGVYKWILVQIKRLLK